MGNEPKSGCIFCNALEQADGPENLIVTRTPLAFVMMNRYPYTSGHIMVVPNVHQPSLELLDESHPGGVNGTGGTRDNGDAPGL